MNLYPERERPSAVAEFQKRVAHIERLTGIKPKVLDVHPDKFNDIITDAFWLTAPPRGMQTLELFGVRVVPGRISWD